MAARSTFIAERLRLPTAEEEPSSSARSVRRSGLRRRRGANRRSRPPISRANPSATEASWETERAAILAADRQRRAIESTDAASRSHARLYQNW